MKETFDLTKFNDGDLIEWPDGSTGTIYTMFRGNEHPLEDKFFQITDEDGALWTEPADLLRIAKRIT